MKAALSLLFTVAGLVLVWAATSADPISSAGAGMVAPTLAFGVALCIAGAAVLIPSRES